MDIVYIKKDVIVSVKMGADKSLIYLMIFLINLGAIILTIISIIALIKDQKKELK